MSHYLELADRRIATDREGFLKHLSDWDEQVAVQLAAREHIELGGAHWELIHCVRAYYAEYQLSPAMRPLVNYVRRELGEDKGRSVYLMRLFPGSPARLLSKIAGLPRPDNCL